MKTSDELRLIDKMITFVNRTVPLF